MYLKDNDKEPKLSIVGLVMLILQGFTFNCSVDKTLSNMCLLIRNLITRTKSFALRIAYLIASPTPSGKCSCR
jgi:hypothetical protein